MMVQQDAERRIIEAILRDNRVYYAIRLNKRHFHEPAHRAVFAAIGEVLSRGEEATQITLIGGDGVSAEVLATYEPMTVNVDYYAKQLRERQTLAMLHAVLTDSLRMAGELTSSEVIDYATSQIMQLSQDDPEGLIKISELTHYTLDRIEEARKRGGDMPGVPSGYYGIDAMTGGFRGSELCIIAARTSIGKTAFALNMAENMARKDIKTAFFSLEMSREEVMDRLTSSVSQLSHQRIRKGQVTCDADFGRLGDALERLHDEPMWICDAPNMRFEDVRNMSRMFCSQGGQIVFIDYMTLIKFGDPRVSRPERVGALSAELKAMSRELRVPVIVLSQLNRDSENAEPSLSSIRQSGEIEENADMIFLLHRERDEEDTKVIIAKHRNGPTGTVSMRFNRDTLRFSEIERRETEEGKR